MNVGTIAAWSLVLRELVSDSARPCRLVLSHPRHVRGAGGGRSGLSGTLEFASSSTIAIIIMMKAYLQLANPSFCRFPPGFNVRLYEKSPIAKMIAMVVTGTRGFGRGRRFCDTTSWLASGFASRSPQSRSLRSPATKEQKVQPFSERPHTWKARGSQLSATFNELWAKLGHSGPVFWATWLSR